MTAATIATGRGSRFAHVTESTWGTTPATPSFNTLRVTNSSLRPVITKATSQEFTTDRNVRHDFLTSKKAEGRVEGELIYGKWEGFLQAAMGGTWTTNVLKTGNTFRSFSIEETFELGNLNQYHRYLGCCINAFEISADPADTIKLAFDVMAREHTTATSAISGATYTAAADSRSPATTEGISGVTFGGITATPIVRSFSLRVENNLRERPVFDDARSVQFGLGMQDITGEIECYFDDRQIYEEIYTQSDASLSLTLGHTANEKYTIAIHKMSWGDGALSPRTRDNDIMVTMPFRALYAPAQSTAVTITRAVA